ncbi:hypothetical protein ACFWN1_32720 [Streptomyces sp. NPDC058459]|uniref:hypothetical protein n=1 Tax=Streptomyces sp. NPDC058459 TaxID=3346508 RepID=UPI0036492420
MERQTAAMRVLSRQAFPEVETGLDETLAAIEAARAQRCRDAEATRAAALQKAREDRAARDGTVERSV